MFSATPNFSQESDEEMENVFSLITIPKLVTPLKDTPKRKRGRPLGSKNKPKETDPTARKRTAPQMPGGKRRKN